MVMDKIIEDYRKEGFTLREWAVYGLLAVAMAAVCILAGA